MARARVDLISVQLYKSCRYIPLCRIHVHKSVVVGAVPDARDARHIAPAMITCTGQAHSVSPRDSVSQHFWIDDYFLKLNKSRVLVLSQIERVRILILKVNSSIDGNNNDTRTIDRCVVIRQRLRNTGTR